MEDWARECGTIPAAKGFIIPLIEIRTKVRETLWKETGGSASEPDWDYEAAGRVRDSMQDEASKQQYGQEIVS